MHTLETNALKNILSSLINREQLEKLITAQLETAYAHIILEANPTKNFSMKLPEMSKNPALKIIFKKNTINGLVDIYFKTSNTEGAKDFFELMNKLS